MNRLILALGSNQGSCIDNLIVAKQKLERFFGSSEASRIYSSQAVDFTNQPDFYNQVLSFKLPKLSPLDVLNQTMDIENSLGRTRTIKYGPRTIDIDIIFFGDEKMELENLTIPHPRFLQRSFVVLPLLELSIKDWLLDNFIIPDHFVIEAEPID